MTTNLLKNHQRLPSPEENLVPMSRREADAGRVVACVGEVCSNTTPFKELPVAS